MRTGFHCQRLVYLLRVRAASRPSTELPLSVPGGDDDGDDGAPGQGGGGSAIVDMPSDPSIECEPPKSAKSESPKTDSSDAVSDGHEDHDPAEPEVN